MADFGKLRRYLALPSRGAGRIQRDVDEELRIHIDMRAESYERQGMPRTEARARALREFGDLEDAREYCASVDRSGQRRRRVNGWLSEVVQDASLTLRQLRRSPAFAVATVLTLLVVPALYALWFRVPRRASATAAPEAPRQSLVPARAPLLFAPDPAE